MNVVIIMLSAMILVLAIISILNFIRISKANKECQELMKAIIEAKEANQELRFENYEYQDIFNKIYKVVFENNKETIFNKLNKTKEVIQSANINNF